ncbi:MAG TPA: hypothetical protein VIL65_01850 [Beijerinckiaceae bacterium]|jgi:hypothetical protein
MIAHLFGRLRAAVRTILAEWRDPYRPELHYMRGPGPRWHERHAADPF